MSISPSNTSILLDTISKSTADGLKFVHINIQSMMPHIDELRCDLFSKNLDAVFISETWLNDTHNDAVIAINGYKLLRNDRPSRRRGGGVAIILKNKYKAKILERSKTDGESEFIFIDVALPSTNMILGCIYKPPNCLNLQHFYDVLSGLCARYQHIIICGDFNINLHKSCNITTEYLSTLSGLGMELVNVDMPTHFQGEPTLLDHILVTEKARIHSYQQLSTPYYSKHDLLFAVYDVPKFNNVFESYSYRDFQNLDVNALGADVLSYNFSHLLMLPIDDAITCFQDQLKILFDIHVPLVTKRIPDPKTPWMTSQILYLRRKRDMAFKSFKIESNLVTKEAQRIVFNNLRNKVVSSIKKAKLAYYSRIFNSNQSTSKLWKNLRMNGVNNKPQVECTISPNELALVFFPVSSSTCNPSAVRERITPMFSFEQISSNEVIRALYSIHSNAIGFDEVSIKFFKLILPMTINVFTDFLNRCILTSQFPSAWKISKVIPVPKGKSNEFRPISLVPALSKVLERLMSNQITEFLYNFELLSKFQSGFRKHHSCKTALLHVTNQIGRAIDQNQIVFLVLIDFSKAFDTIDHQLLLQKLKLRFGFSPHALRLMHNYLYQRKSIVVNNNLQSNEFFNKSGVPQGSILGPLLFSMYAEDMEDIFKYVLPHFYADDTQLLTSSKLDDVILTIDNINKDLRNLLLWSNDNGLKINSNKSKCIVISRRLFDVSKIPPISIGADIINYEKKVTNLGIVMNSNLQWDDHLALTTQKIYYGLRCLWNAAKLFPIKTKTELIKSLLMPHIIYCDVIIGELNSRDNTTLGRAFNSMVRFVYGLRKYDHISHVYKNILGVGLHEYLQCRRLMFMYVLIKTGKPSYLTDALTFLQSSRLRSNLIVPNFQYNQYFKSFFVFDAIKWNDLPEDIKASPSYSIFKNKLISLFN